MVKFLRRVAITMIALALPLSLGLSMGLGTAANASTTAQVAQRYSEYLAGHAGEGNGVASYNDVRGQVVAPSECLVSATCPDGVAADSVADGMLLAQNVSVGGEEVGLALVLDSTSCPGDFWTVEDADGTYSFTGPVIDVSSLHPAMNFGNPICLSPGQSEYLELYQIRTQPKFVDLIAGVSRTDNDIADQLSLGHKVYFHSFGFGANTTSGAVAATLDAGTLVEFESADLTEVRGNFHKDGRALSLAKVNYDTFTGTEDGGPPSVANPVTLEVGPIAANGGFTVTSP